MDETIDVCNVDKSWVLVIVEKDFRDLYDDIKDDLHVNAKIRYNSNFRF